ncbi:MAG: N(4)-(beta-N-acetylglucosaminyl)-L-asparaginase [Bacteroidota bacterium]|nr:N(4)-(beta-N-acetylglucosaminyl)-L-asparaginase [Bacteroidota bacterium]
MTNRRNFIKNTALVIGSMPFLSLAESKGNSKIKGKPIVVSTWDFGKVANQEAWKILSEKGSAVDAVEKGVMFVESDPTQMSVGLAALPDRDGHPTLDACIMKGNGDCGSVVFLEHIMHPISVARGVMEKTPHIILAGEGAQQFAINTLGMKIETVINPKSQDAYQEWLKKSEYKPIINIENHDTIGMIAMDANGLLAGACTTSGLAFKMHGRVGDSPIIGAGLFVDEDAGAVTATGVGEEVIRIAGSHLVAELMRNGMHPEKACKTAVERIYKRKKDNIKNIQVGFIAINLEGEVGAFGIHKGFTYAVKTDTIDEIYQGKFLME